MRNPQENPQPNAPRTRTASGPPWTDPPPRRDPARRKVRHQDPRQRGRSNPARCADTYGGLRAAQAASLRDALTLMHDRGEGELHFATLTRALRALDGERRARLVTVPPPGET
ncbi:hypothetical protein [Streptomyces kasugaensis]|uniref:hypothetical protein n=1 Tax=Streptomyces kasugaensis TaxID=1946 RepID=UPI003BF86DCD